MTTFDLYFVLKVVQVLLRVLGSHEKNEKNLTRAIFTLVCSSINLVLKWVIAVVDIISKLNNLTKSIISWSKILVLICDTQ